MKIPGKATISNRTSTMASQFARARAPYIPPTPTQAEARYRLLRIDPTMPECAYCGGLPTEWDHLFPMVTGSRWTGYFTEIANLVPTCGKCNQSRGSKPFAQWMRGKAAWSPLVVLQSKNGMSRDAALVEIERRVAAIERAIAAQPPTRLFVDHEDTLELELEQCRLELNKLLYRGEAIAAKLRARYQALAMPFPHRTNSATGPANPPPGASNQEVS